MTIDAGVLPYDLFKIEAVESRRRKIPEKLPFTGVSDKKSAGRNTADLQIVTTKLSTMTKPRSMKRPVLRPGP